NLNAVRKAQRIITVSDTARTEMLATLRLPPDRVVAIHNGVDFSATEASSAALDWEPPNGDAPYVLFGGSFEPRKNLMRLIEAFDLAAHRGLIHDLVMIVDSGSGHAHRVMNRARRLPCADRLHFLSGLDEPALRAVYREATIFAFPTLSEGFGLPPLQAMASGVPVIASDIPIMREVLGEAAYYIDPYSPSDIADALMALGSDGPLCERLATAGRRRAADFTWEETAKRTLDVYRSAVGAAPPLVAAGVP
ncbi:MAG: glycosyltransferase family 4 protein, partial [Dehalococcoidia bacterium]